MSDPKVTAEGEETPPPKKPGEEQAKAGCAKCGDDMPEEARYCAKCGARAGAESPAKDEGDDEEAPESSKPGARLAGGATVASMLGLRADASEPAVKTALSALLSEVRHVRGVLGASDAAGVRGKLRAMGEDVAEGVKAKASLKREREANEKRERVEGLLALSSRLGGSNPELTRGQLLRDVLGVDASGKEVVIGLEPNPASLIATAPIKEFRAYRDGKLLNAGEARDASPFEAARDAARERATSATVTQSDIETAQRMGRKPEEVAASRAALFPTNGAARAPIGV